MPIITTPGNTYKVWPRDNGGLSASDITGIVIGTVSGVLTIIGLIISFFSWKYPSSSPGQLGNTIRKKISLHGGNARGGDASGVEAHGGDAQGGDVSAHHTSNKEGDIHAGNARGGDAAGVTSFGGAARGGDVSFA